MRIAIFGAGGVGGYFGARLALAGHDVVFIARGKHLEAMKAFGLRIESATGELIVDPVQATDDPQQVRGADVVMFCVKLWDVESAAAQLPAMLKPGGGCVIPFQNGVEAPAVVARHVGGERTLGGVAYIAATIRAPGVVAHTGTMAQLRVGTLKPDQDARARAFVDACKGASIDCELSPDITTTIWKKFIFLAPMSGCTSVARQPIGIVRSDPDLRATFVAAVTETVTLARALNVPLESDIVDAQLKFLDRLPADMRSSMMNDLLYGNRLEAPWLSGAVARMSREKGLSAPVNATLYAALKPYIDGGATGARKA
ncbi:MAG TPA: 2-dehydropantoate 2-reductase [Casimicrobiaceae bacterium]|nr:2-dehydropantoate 2-reductase [Casimicrobiaceae bacterium]